MDSRQGSWDSVNEDKKIGGQKNGEVVLFH
jgi:hypothetical protein